MIRKRLGLKRLPGAVLLGLLLLLFSCALAAEPVFFVSPTGVDSAQAIHLVCVNNRKYYLFLPGNADPAALRIGFTGASKLELNGAEVTGPLTAESLAEHNEIRFDGRKEISFDVMRGSPGLPVLYITTETGGLKQIHSSKKNKEAGTLCMVNGAGETEYDGNLAYIKIRGNSSVRFPKRNYQIKLEKGTDLLGFGKAKKWILTGNWLDRSMIRNQLNFDLAEYVGLPYTPEHQQAEVYINHEYTGLYLLSEKVEVNEGRVDIRDLEKETEKLNEGELSGYARKTERLSQTLTWKGYEIPDNPEDITGGYLLEYCKAKGNYQSAKSGFETRLNVYMEIRSPEYATKEQAAYIAAFMQGFENAIFARSGLDPETGKHYSEFVDMDSLVLKYMINEFSQNYDGNVASEFFFKPPDSVSKVAFAGPVWDMDNTYASYAQANIADVIGSPGFLYIADAGSRYWWPNLYKHEDFRRRVGELYTERFAGAAKILLGLAEDPEGRLKSVEDYAQAIEASAEMNFALHPGMREYLSEMKTGRTFRENIAYLCRFIEKRNRYLEKQWTGTTGE